MRAFRYRIDFDVLDTSGKEAGVSVAEFCRRAGMSRPTWEELRHGQGFVSDAVSEQIVTGLAGIGMEGRRDAILTPLGRGSVKIMGDGGELRRRLRNAAERHGFTSHTYLDQLFAASEDPLKELEKTAAGV